MIKALKNEKKKRSRGKRLNLCGDKVTGAQFYSLVIVRRAIAYSQQKEAEEQQEQDWIAAKRVTTAANKLLKEQEKEARCI